MSYGCYFGDCLLKIKDEDNLLRNSKFSLFLNPKPFHSVVTCTVIRGEAFEKSNLKVIADDQNVIVRVTETGWLFSSGDARYDCDIDADRTCSELNVYLPLDKGLDESDSNETLLQLLRIVLECHLTHCGFVTLHASCVQHHHEAILFTAPSGTGKSTQAMLWQNRFGAEILSGDRPLVGSVSGIFQAFGVPWDGKEQIFSQSNFPVRAIVELRQANENRIRRLDRDQAFRLLMKQCFIPMWDDEAKFLAVKTIRALTESIPFYRLFCLPDEEATGLLHSVLYNQNSLTGMVQKNMKIVDGFILRNVADEWIVMPAGDHIKNFEGAIVLNEVSAFIWKQLSEPLSRDDLLAAILSEYDIDQTTASADLDEFLALLDSKNFLQKN